MRYEILIYEDLYSGTSPGDPAAVCIYANSKKEREEKLKAARTLYLGYKYKLRDHKLNREIISILL